jgi:hypothetical protein
VGYSGSNDPATFDPTYNNIQDCKWHVGSQRRFAYVFFDFELTISYLHRFGINSSELQSGKSNLHRPIEYVLWVPYSSRSALGGNTVSFGHICAYGLTAGIGRVGSQGKGRTLQICSHRECLRFLPGRRKSSEISRQNGGIVPVDYDGDSDYYTYFRATIW